MKQFIEVTVDNPSGPAKILINVDHILSVSDSHKIFLSHGRSYYLAKESYDEIKDLIEKAQPKPFSLFGRTK